MALKLVNSDPMERYADSPEAAYVRALEALPDHFLECREGQHSWRLMVPYTLIDCDRDADRRPVSGERQYVERSWRCQSCHKWRFDRYRVVSMPGYQRLVRLRPEYDTPEGYAITGLGSLPGARELARGVVFSRLVAAGRFHKLEEVRRREQ